MSGYTPTTDRVRHCATTATAWLGFQPESFDRWLARHDAEIRTAALEEAAVIVKGNLGRIWIATETLGDIADAIRAAKVDPS